MSVALHLAEVLTNSEEDSLLRVKVSAKALWPEESGLIPSLNSIYLEKGDIVLLLVQEMKNPFILGKLLLKDQTNPLDDPNVLFTAKKDDSWIIGTLVNDRLRVESSEGFEVTGFHKDLLIKTPDGSLLEFKDNNITIHASGKLTIENKTLNLKSILEGLLDALSTTVPTTMGSPAAQNFNASIITAISDAKVKLGNLMD